MQRLKVEIVADSKFPVDRKAIRSKVASVLESRGYEASAIVSVSVVGDRKMSWINKKFRNKSGTTDVLSFPTDDPSQNIDNRGFFHHMENGRVLGDIVISHPQAVLAASRKNQLLDEAIGELVEHGMLHLLGIHHN